MANRIAKTTLLAIFCFYEVAYGQSASPRKDIPAIAKAAKNAVVTIVMEDNDKPIALGTGFLVSPDGAILTNYHVIANGNTAAVKLSDGRMLLVDGVLAADKVRDLAVIKIHGKNFQTLILGNSDQVEVGEEVVAIGHPLGLGLTVSNGILSAVPTIEKEGGKFLQVTAPISHGSSGGPLFNMAGEVIGITSGINENGENLNFAVPVNDAKLLLHKQYAAMQALPNEPEESETAPPPAPPKTKPLQPAFRLNDVGHIKEGDEFESAFTQASTCDHIKLYRESDSSHRESDSSPKAYYDIQFIEISDTTAAITSGAPCAHCYALFMIFPNRFQANDYYKSAAVAANKACMLVAFDRPPWW